MCCCLVHPFVFLAVMDAGLWLSACQHPGFCLCCLCWWHCGTACYQEAWCTEQQLNRTCCIFIDRDRKICVQLGTEDEAGLIAELNMAGKYGLCCDHGIS